jgi:hypothetical protein
MKPSNAWRAASNTTHRFRLRSGLLTATLLALLGSSALPGCDDEENAAGGGELTLAGESELFPSLEYATGLVPAGSPVQASFTVSATGKTTLAGKAIASGAESSTTLSGVPDSGRFAIEGGFALIGQLKIDIDGLPSYDGPIPGIENVDIPIVGETKLSPFSIGKAVSARADVPPADLPGIPLPGGIPGQLVIAIADGSFVELSLSASCAGADGKDASWVGSVDRAGVLVLAPRVEVEVPFIGTQSFDIPQLTVDLALGQSEIAATGVVGGYGEKPASGDHVSGACTAGEGGADTGGAGAGSADGGAPGSSGGNGAGGDPSSSTSSSGASCDIGSCFACAECAVDGPCMEEAAVCANNKECSVIANCQVNCSTQECVDTCYNEHPDGQADFVPWEQCFVCQQCPVTCDAIAQYCGD